MSHQLAPLVRIRKFTVPVRRRFAAQGWRFPLNGASGTARVHFYQQDGWTLCKRWREIGVQAEQAAQSRSRSLPLDEAEFNRATLCVRCWSRFKIRRKRGKV
jgi:hypothetical protein